MSEQERLKDLWGELGESDQMARELRYDYDTRSFRASGAGDPDDVVRVTKADAHVFAGSRGRQR